MKSFSGKFVGFGLQHKGKNPSSKWDYNPNLIPPASSKPSKKIPCKMFVVCVCAGKSPWLSFCRAEGQQETFSTREVLGCDATTRQRFRFRRMRFLSREKKVKSLMHRIIDVNGEVKKRKRNWEFKHTFRQQAAKKREKVNDRSDGKSLSFCLVGCVCVRVNVTTIIILCECIVTMKNSSFFHERFLLLQPHSLRVFTFSEGIQLRKKEEIKTFCVVHNGCCCAGKAFVCVCSRVCVCGWVSKMGD